MDQFPMPPDPEGREIAVPALGRGKSIIDQDGLANSAYFSEVYHSLSPLPLPGRLFTLRLYQSVAGKTRQSFCHRTTGMRGIETCITPTL